MTPLNSQLGEKTVTFYFYCICRMMRNLLLPAESSEPRQVVGMIHPVANGNNFFEALNLDSHDLCHIIRKIELHLKKKESRTRRSKHESFTTYD